MSQQSASRGGFVATLQEDNSLECRSALGRRTDPCGEPSLRATRHLTLEPFQHSLELSVLQPKFANKLAAQELYLVIEADGLSGNGGSVTKLGSSD